MKGLGLPSGSTVFYLVLLVGLVYGLVWFSGTSVADSLRSFGVPVPYCTVHPLVSLCEMDYTSPTPALFRDANSLFVFLISRPSDDLLNSFCALSEDGANVRMVLSGFLRDDNEFLSALDSCKVKYRFSNNVLTNELSTGACYLSFTGPRGVYTCCEPVVSAFNDYFEEVWKGASP